VWAREEKELALARHKWESQPGDASQMNALNEESSCGDETVQQANPCQLDNGSQACAGDDTLVF